MPPSPMEQRHVAERDANGRILIDHGMMPDRIRQPLPITMGSTGQNCEHHHLYRLQSRVVPTLADIITMGMKAQGRQVRSQLRILPVHLLLRHLLSTTPMWIHEATPCTMFFPPRMDIITAHMPELRTAVTSQSNSRSNMSKFSINNTYSLLSLSRKHIDSHLKPFICRKPICRDLRFSSAACLVRHEREAHKMHGHDESLCEYPPCTRSAPGNGFRRSFNCKDHMTRCHGWVESGPADKQKRRTIHSCSNKNESVSKTRNQAASRKKQIIKLRQEYDNRKSTVEALCSGLDSADPLDLVHLAQIQADLQTLSAIHEALQKLEGRSGTSS
jgi:hypothetical protein